MQSKRYEPISGSFFTEGKKLIDGERILGITMPWYARKLPPRHADALLIILFAIAFFIIAFLHCPFQICNNNEAKEVIIIVNNPNNYSL